ncbi:helix-turn-helix protein [Saccharopolyspora erythraea NRRL 2338]|uniref:DNA-binding protein n=2 Tax=Saccharopolyspora erythraea TaxID=1836 RepID=A4FQ94_SACEN|nr:helix-turn-helix transcriptional regulator [Saccharopolyspora erythraea]EQD86292.1 XRE family transcriptional regulator [Saccharopolyspora erythraea D]PFG92820.1 helix-turn-helix protein [Saccharopolyspora erythraea NRRL 2338]QRK89733.1 helix-turn-helix domain-containing protein [Saccharopolyspora erythraea]CAM06219.1 DNA-binding protein [Saccharopolyspora erythraea NRRL 2338]
MDRHELAQFLRNRRESLRPAEVGLPAGTGRRRTPGLRREEVAWRAGVSANYYERLEQARAPRPSPQVVAALARALRLGDDESAHLARLAGQTPPSRERPAAEVPEGVRMLLDRVGAVPAYVLNARHDVLAWNAMAAELITDFAALPAAEQNLLRLSVRFGEQWCRGSGDGFLRQAAADLRQAAVRYPSDTGIAELVRDCSAVSAEFAASWHAHDVRGPQTLRKRINHPELGALDLDCQTLHVPGTDQRLVTFSAEPGSVDHDKLLRLQLRALRNT